MASMRPVNRTEAPGPDGPGIETPSTGGPCIERPGIERPGIERHRAAVREFNRFYTSVIGLLQAGFLDTSYSLTEARVIFEIARAGHETDAAQLRRALDLDAGYLSRILARFEADGLIGRQRSAADGRRQAISLTPAGHGAAQLLDERADAQVGRLLSTLTVDDQRRLTAAMAEIRQVMGVAAGMVVLRAPLPGDLGWVIQGNGALYAAEYGWDGTYEALVARIVADYAAGHDAEREAAWIAEVDGGVAGCVFCVRDSDTTARLRLLLVEPRVRGRGLGARLVAECVGFARRAGYREIVLWTNDVLVQARRIYERAGFELVDSEPHHSFGHDLVGQTWRLSLS